MGWLNQLIAPKQVLHTVFDPAGGTLNALSGNMDQSQQHQLTDPLDLQSQRNVPQRVGNFLNAEGWMPIDSVNFYAKVIDGEIPFNEAFGEHNALHANATMNINDKNVLARNPDATAALIFSAAAAGGAAAGGGAAGGEGAAGGAAGAAGGAAVGGEVLPAGFLSGIGEAAGTGAANTGLGGLAGAGGVAGSSAAVTSVGGLGALGAAGGALGTGSLTAQDLALTPSSGSAIPAEVGGGGAGLGNQSLMTTPSDGGLFGSGISGKDVMQGASALYGAYTAKQAADAQEKAAKEANALTAGTAAQNRADMLPWLNAGKYGLEQIQSGLQPGGRFSKDFGMADFQQDPGYSFRMAEGLKALDRQAAARGGLISGAALKASQRYGQDAASQEYQNAFNRYQINRTAQLAPLQSLAGQGQTTSSQLGTFGQNNAMLQNENLANQANARASGYVGVANALTSGLGSYLNYQQNAENANQSKYGK